MKNAFVECRYGDIFLNVGDTFSASGDEWTIISFDSDTICCKNYWNDLNWFDPVFVAERITEKSPVTNPVLA